MKKTFLFISIALLTLTINNVAMAGLDPIYTGFFSNDAVGGYDTVEYLKQNKAVKGRAEFQTQWKGANWLFSSKENLETFLKSPEKYAPQYGGYCAWAVANGYEASGDPLVFSIVDNKLYLNYNENIRKRWEKDIPGFIKSANKNWKKLVAN